MNTRMVLCALLLLVVGFSYASSMQAQAKPAKPVLPAPVAKAFQETYPAARILAFSREREKGRIIYEVESRDGTTRRDLLYSTTGEVLEIEETIALAALPPPVRNALETAAPGAKVSRAERVTRDSVVTYEFAVRVSGRARAFNFDSAGRPVKP